MDSETQATRLLQSKDVFVTPNVRVLTSLHHSLLCFIDFNVTAYIREIHRKGLAQKTPGADNSSGFFITGVCHGNAAANIE